MITRKFLLAAGAFFAGAGVVSAATYQPFAPQGGILSSTTVPNVYADGSTGTLAQIGQMADGSVQQTDVGAASGVAPLDSNKMMSSPVSGDASSAPATAAGAPTPRVLAARFSDEKNVADYGAALDGSSSDLSKIQSIYNATSDGSVLHVPNGSAWNGIVIAPDPNKNITWIFDKTYDFSGWQHSPGDGDVAISHKYGLQVSRMDSNTNNWRQSPANFIYWNDDSNYCGAYCSNWNQQSAAAFSAISGPTSSGNTSPVNIGLRSFGNGPSSAYDVGLPLTVFKYGQNSVWGLDVVTNDFSGKSPSAFATWNEFDMWTNGQDIKSWDDSYGTPQAGHRSVHFVSVAHQTAQIVKWSPNAPMQAHASGKGSVQIPSLLSVSGPSGVAYVWYPVANGTTGSTQPTFPDPTRITGVISNGVLTVKKLVSGQIGIGDTVTGASPVEPVKITGQISGASGGIGTYSIDNATAAAGDANNSEALYTAPLVQDGSVSWQFGEELNSTVSSILWVTGGAGDGVDTVVGVDKNVTVNNAVLNTELATMGPSGVPIRMAPGQKIDFTGSGAAAGQNLHTLGYSPLGLSYAVNGVAVRTVADNGASIVPISTPTATGTTIDDAAVVTGPYVVVAVYSDNAGVKLDTSMGNSGVQKTAVNNSAHPLNLYPINGAWSFLGHSPGQAIVLPPYAAVTLTTVSNYYNQIGVEYHPPAP